MSSAVRDAEGWGGEGCDGLRYPGWGLRAEGVAQVRRASSVASCPVLVPSSSLFPLSGAASSFFPLILFRRLLLPRGVAPRCRAGTSLRNWPALREIGLLRMGFAMREIGLLRN